MTALDRVRAVLRETPLIDGHNDLVSGLRLFHGYDVDIVAGSVPELQTDIPRLRSGGVGAQFWAAWVPPSLSPGDAVTATLEQIDAIHRMIERHPGTFALARSAEDVLRNFRSGHISAIIGVEGGHSIAGSLGVLRSYAKLGVRYLTLTHAAHTGWADSATDDAPGVGGLDDVGRAIVAELNRLGIVVDLSHTSLDTQRDALAVSSAPVLYTHSGAASVTDHPRNVPDDLLRAVARTGGVVQVAFVPEFVSAEVYDWQRCARAEAARLGLTDDGFWKPAPRPGHDTAAHLAALADLRTEPGPAAAEYARWVADHPRPTATRSQVADHIEHVRAEAGIEHVGIGADFDGMFVTPDGLPDVSAYPSLLIDLVERGWSDEELHALAGRNVLRVLRDAERTATEACRPDPVRGDRTRTEPHPEDDQLT